MADFKISQLDTMSPGDIGDDDVIIINDGNVTTKSTTLANLFTSDVVKDLIASGDGQINVNAGNGLQASGSNATANQSGNTTRTLAVKAANTTINVASGGIKVVEANLAKVPSATSADSATKLKTARNLWGQSFNGTANINGSMQGVNNITGADANMTIQPKDSDTARTLILRGNNITTGTGGGVVVGRTDGGFIKHYSGVVSGFRFYKPSQDTIYGALLFDKLTANVNYTFPNKAGTIALTSDIPSAPTIGDGQINVNAGNGLQVSGSNATANQSGNTTRTLSAKLDGTTLAVSSAGLKVNNVPWGSVTGKPSTYPPSSHNHTFNSLTSKGSGTGNYKTTGYFVAGETSGNVGLTTNDGQGNANVTFNHVDGIPEQDGNSARIVSNVDSTSGAYIAFEVKSNVKKNTSVSTTERLSVKEAGVYAVGTKFVGDLTGNADTATTATSSDSATTATTATNCSRQVIAGNGLSGGGALTANRTLSVKTNGNTISVGSSGIKVVEDNLAKVPSATSADSATTAGSCTGNAATATTATNCSRQVIAGNGLSGGGALTANRTLTVKANGNTISVGSSGIKVVEANLATVPSATSADTATTATTATNCSRQVNSGNGLSGGGALTANRTLSVKAANTTIDVASGGIKVVEANLAKVPSATSADSATTAGSCTGNAATATKLKTARTLWGVSFNGSANISGAMTNVNNITGVDANMTIQPKDSASSRNLILKGNNNTGGTGGSVLIGDKARGAVSFYSSTSNTAYRFYKKGSTSVYGALKFDGLGENRTYTFPNKAGTIALTSDIPSAPTIGDGQINVSAGNGLQASGSNATANQSGNTTRTLAVKANGNTISVSSSGIKVVEANLATVPSATSAGSCTGNAATATKLKTARTLWGVSFNGSANISGQMTGVNAITGADANMAIQPKDSGTARSLTLRGNNNSGSNVEIGNPSRGNVSFFTGVTNSGYRFYKKGTNNIYGTFKFDNITANRTYTFPNVGGTIATTASDITGNAATASKVAITANTTGTFNMVMTNGGASSGRPISIDAAVQWNATDKQLKSKGFYGTDINNLSWFNQSVYVGQATPDDMDASTTGGLDARLNIFAGVNPCIKTITASAGAGNYKTMFSVYAYNQNLDIETATQVGYIKASSANVNFDAGPGGTYTSTSDYRIKANVVTMDAATPIVKLLKPVKFNYINIDDTTQHQGFIAHELQEHVPQAVFGTKDEVNEDGTPKYQGIDVSKLVPLLTKALQEALVEIDSLKARVTELEI